MCETPDWFIRNIKGDIITGGIGRRFVLIYETDDPDPVPRPIITAEARAAEVRVKQRLIDIRKVTGKFEWSPDALPMYDAWYIDNHHRRIKENNQMMRGYLKSKHIQMFKVMMILDSVSDKPMFLFTKDLLDHSAFLLDSPEKNMPKLSIAAGRNEMMGPQQKLLDILQVGWNGEPGWMPKKLLFKAIETEMTPNETSSTLYHLKETEQVFEKEYLWPRTDTTPEVKRMMVVLPWKRDELLKSGEARIKPKGTQ
jgi:hypothetical protein